MQSCASPAWSVHKAGLRVKPTFNAAYTNPRMKSNHPGVSFEAAISPASFTCILSCNWESPTQEPAWRNWRWWHCSPRCWCHVLSTEIHRLRRLCTSQGKSKKRPSSNPSYSLRSRRWTEHLCTFNQGYRSLSSHRSVISFQYGTAKLHFPWRFSVKCRA